MSRIKLMATINTRPALAMLAVLLLLSGLAFPGITRAQNDSDTENCFRGLELPAELAELDLAALQVELQELVDADPEATVTLLFDGQEVATVRADLLLADEAVLVALLEGQSVNVTFEYSEREDLGVIVAIEVSTAGDCTDESCVSGIELPAALADLDVAGLREALEELIAADADATLTLLAGGEEFATVRADLLIGLSDPVLGAVLAGDLLGMFIVFEGETAEIVGIALPSPECERTGGPPDAEPTVVPIPDNQQGGGKGTTPDNQQTDDKDTGAGGKTPDNQQGGGKTPDNQQGGGDKDTDTGAGGEQQDDTQDDDKDTGAGDEQQVPDNQQGGEDKDAGAGDEQETPDNQQEDTQDDVQDDQQAEMPEELPDTGAGGLATGAAVPGGSLGLAASGLLAAGYAVLRRR